MRLGWVFGSLLLAVLCLLPGCQSQDAPPREEKFVTVRLNDSLKRYDSVEIVILAGGDSTQVVGTLWKGPLARPGAVPSYRLADGEDRALTVRVRGFDSAGNLVLNFMISKQDGLQVIADLPVPVIKPPDTDPVDTVKPEALRVRLIDLSVSPGTLTPAFDSSQLGYRVDVAWAESSITVIARTSPPPAIATLDGETLSNGIASKPVALKVGENALTVKVVHAGKSQTYALNVWRADPTPVDTSRKDPYAAWKQRGLVFVNLKTLGMDRAWTETGVPLLLRLTRTNFDFTAAASNGRDLRFSRLDGTPIPYELVRWEPTQSRAEVWFRADTLRAGDDSARFYMYWGNPIANPESDGAKVFGTGDGHSAVYHLGEKGEGAPGEYKDAGGRYHGRGGSGDGANVPERVEGVVDYGQNFTTA